jgi:hypothetical protein
MKQSAGSVITIIVLLLSVGFVPDSGQAQVRDNQTAVKAAPAPLAAASFPWPSQFSDSGQAFTVYPPQLDTWQGERLEARAAVAVLPAGADKPLFGQVWLSARTDVDSSTGVVKVREITATRASFPTAGANASAYLDYVRKHLLTLSWSVSRERLESDLAIEHASGQAQSEPPRNAAPRIVYSEAPAIVVPIDGPAQLRQMPGLELLRVINTRALIVQDKTTRRYYLFAAGHWMQALALEGPWTEAYVRPAALAQAKQQALASGQVDVVEGGEPAQGRAPLVFVATGPAELVQTDGAPQYLPIQGTNLLYVTNTPNRLFLDLPTQQYYLLLSGRWYRSASLSSGSWEYVAGANLPGDFALIPPEHPSENVRASVPGTPQAQEALIANSVPQLASVQRSAATLEITYDGSPQFRPIEGTPLHYALNAPLPLIQVDPGSFYALDNGVWFVSNSAFGPWTVASWVPPVVYTIPRSSPLHYVTYVRVYEATPEVVYEGYTPGYVGSYAAPGGTVVYGSGWDYQPWVGSVWYGAPLTWGCGFSVFATWWSPWPWRPWWGAGWGPYPWYRPWWGPWIAPVGVAPVFVARPVPVAAHPVAPVKASKATVNNVHANTTNMAGIFQRWGKQMATPVGWPATPDAAKNNNGARSTALSAQPAVKGAEPRTLATRTTPGNPNLQVFRRVDGQWQQFHGNGQWQNVRVPNPNVFNGAPQTPPPEAGGGGTGMTSNGSSVPTHGLGGSTTRQPMASSASHGAMAPQSNLPGAASTSTSRGPTPASPERFAGQQMRPFAAGGARSAHGWDAEEDAPMGRAGGALVTQGPGTAGGHAVQGRKATAGGHGHGWSSAGVGRMGGASMH